MRGNSDRFFVKEGLGQDLICIDDKDLIKQWTKVMRFGEGDVVRLFDGSGWEYKYQISNSKFPISKKISNIKSKISKNIILGLVDKRFVKENKRKVFLGFGILKDQTRMEWMVEKCTELGVDGFYPIVCDNSQVVLDKLKIRNEKLKMKRMDRLEKKIIEACEQCGRVRVPGIEGILSVSDIDNFVREDLRVRPVEVIVMEKLRITNYELRNEFGKDILLLVGPEGGWSERELKLFEDKGYLFWSINENVLRADTAAVAGVTMINYEL